MFIDTWILEKLSSDRLKHFSKWIINANLITVNTQLIDYTTLIINANLITVNTQLIDYTTWIINANLITVNTQLIDYTTWIINANLITVNTKLIDYKTYLWCALLEKNLLLISHPFKEFIVLKFGHKPLSKCLLIFNESYNCTLFPFLLR